jgi:excisionase family DNA binding protein
VKAPTLVTAKELAEILSRDEETIYRWARQRKVPHLRLPDKGYRFPLEEIMDTLRVDPHEEDAA